MCTKIINKQLIVPKNMLSWIQGAAILRHRTSYGTCMYKHPTPVQGYSVWHIQYVVVSLRLYHNHAQCLHQALSFPTIRQWCKWVGLCHWSYAPRCQGPESKYAITMHNQYIIHCTYVSKYCEPLTDWSISLKRHDQFEAFYYYCKIMYQNQYKL